MKIGNHTKVNNDKIQQSQSTPAAQKNKDAQSIMDKVEQAYDKLEDRFGQLSDKFFDDANQILHQLEIDNINTEVTERTVKANTEFNNKQKANSDKYSAENNLNVKQGVDSEKNTKNTQIKDSVSYGVKSEDGKFSFTGSTNAQLAFKQDGAAPGFSLEPTPGKPLDYTFSVDNHEKLSIKPTKNTEIYSDFNFHDQVQSSSKDKHKPSLVLKNGFITKGSTENKALKYNAELFSTTTNKNNQTDNTLTLKTGTSLNKSTDEISITSGLKTDTTLKDNKLSSRFNYDTDFSADKLLFNKDGKSVSLNTGAFANLGVTTTYDILQDEFVFGSDLTTGFNTALTVVPNNHIKISFAGNGKYTFSTNQVSYSYGAGVSANITPFKKREYPNVDMGVHYSKSGQPGVSDKNSSSERLNFDGSLNLDKNIKLNSSYEINLDDPGANKVTFGAKINF